MRAARMLLPLVAVTAAIATAPTSALAAVSPSLTRGVVDVTTTLGYQSGAAAGTGIVLTATGEILTNNHVIRGATAVRVTDPSTGRSYAATVAAYDPTNDIAVLRITGAAKPKPATLGNSTSVKVGDRVTAVGNAGGVGGVPAAASGRVTALRQSITAVDDDGTSEQLTGLIQMNAALQPGDSGGPLFDRAGRVIGVDTAASSGFGFQQRANVGLAIPINRALNVVHLVDTGRPLATTHVGSTAFLGVQVSAADNSTSGAVVAGVIAGSPAESAGLTAGSVITALNDQPVTSYTSITSLLLKQNAGSTVTLTWSDVDGVSHTASVQTASGPPQ